MEQRPELERIRRRARRRADEDRRIASRQLNVIVDDTRTDAGFVRHTARWERTWANWIVSEWGFDPDYIVRRYGLARRTGDR